MEYTIETSKIEISTNNYSKRQWVNEKIQTIPLSI
jgi:hypothetical protein